MTSDRNIYFKIAEAATKVFGELADIHKRTYTAAELSKYTRKDMYGAFVCKEPAALVFRHALDHYMDEHPDEVHTITDGTFECTMSSEGLWRPLAEFEKLARIPKTEQVKFIAKSKAEVLYKLTATLPVDAALTKKYVGPMRSQADPRFRVAYIDVKNGWLWASNTTIFYGGRCEATLTEGDADMLALPSELASKYAGRTVDVTYYEDGTIECGEDTTSLDNSSQFLGRCRFISAIPKVNEGAKIIIGKDGISKLRKFIKTAKSAKGAIDAMNFDIDGGSLTASYKDEHGKRCATDVPLSAKCEHSQKAAFDRTILAQVLSDCNGEIWLSGRDRASIFEAKNADSFVMAMPILTEETKDYNDNIERTTEYLTTKNKPIMAKKNVETPLIKQYKEMKQKHPDAILLFRVGDFYETFEQDAEDCSEILGITLTRRANGKDEYVQLAGFPYHALDDYLQKLVRAGKRVAICEQLDDPKLVEDEKPTQQPSEDKADIISDDEFNQLKTLVDELIPDNNGEIGWEPFDGEIAIFHLDDDIRVGKCARIIKYVHIDKNSPWRHDVGDIVYKMEFKDTDGSSFYEEANQLINKTYNKVMEKLQEIKAEQAKPTPQPTEPTLKEELRECALAQLPQGAEIIAAKYIPIGDDNGKWQLILKMDGVYRYADIVGAARYLYVCDRTFFTTDEVATLMNIPLALPQPQPKAPTDDILDMKKMFMDEYGKSDSEAMELAESNYTLRNRLVSEKSVEFTFRKKDGSERIAHGTLHPDVVPEVKVDPNKPKREPNPKMQLYYDLDKQQWRCFEKVNLINF